MKNESNSCVPTNRLGHSSHAVSLKSSVFLLWVCTIMPSFPLHEYVLRLQCLYWCSFDSLDSEPFPIFVGMNAERLFDRAFVTETDVINDQRRGKRSTSLWSWPCVCKNTSWMYSTKRLSGNFCVDSSHIRSLLVWRATQNTCIPRILLGFTHAGNAMATQAVHQPFTMEYVDHPVLQGGFGVSVTVSVLTMSNRKQLFGKGPLTFRWRIIVPLWRECWAGGAAILTAVLAAHARQLLVDFRLHFWSEWKWILVETGVFVNIPKSLVVDIVHEHNEFSEGRGKPRQPTHLREFQPGLLVSVRKNKTMADNTNDTFLASCATMVHSLLYETCSDWTETWKSEVSSLTLKECQEHIKSIRNLLSWTNFSLISGPRCSKRTNLFITSLFFSDLWRWAPNLGTNCTHSTPWTNSRRSTTLVSTSTTAALDLGVWTKEVFSKRVSELAWNRLDPRAHVCMTTGSKETCLRHGWQNLVRLSNPQQLYS